MRIKMKSMSLTETTRHINPFTQKKKEDGKQEASSDTTKYLYYFAAFVIFCILISVGIKITVLFRSSTFNSSSYSVLVKAKQPFVLILNKPAEALSIIYLKPLSKNLQTSVYYGVPIDGVVEHANDVSPDKFLSFNNFIMQFLMPFTYQNMNSIDMLKFLNASFGLSHGQRKTYRLHLLKNGEVSGLSQSDLLDILKDPDIINEAISIEVVNATSVDGLAGEVALLIKNTGGNVVSVTSQNSEGTSSISTNSDSITVERFSHLLQIPVLRSRGSATADIVIVLGEDFVRKIR